MGVQRSPHGDFHYEIAAVRRNGSERVHEYAAEDPLHPGDVVRLEGRYWLIAAIEPAEGAPARARSKPARYRLRLRHPDGREELGAFRRFRPSAPRLGHALTTLERGQTISWAVVDSRLAEDEEGEPYLDLVAERDYSEVEPPPDYELEHTLIGDEDELPPGGAAALARAEETGLAIELVALEPGEEPDWEAAERFIDALVLEEVEDYLLELAGVNRDRDRKETWLQTVKQRLLSDLELFRADIVGDHDQIEEWSFRDGRIFASVGSWQDEGNPESGHGWMVRLADAEALGAAGFERIRKAQL